MIISIDHGNKQIKTVHCPPFTSGLKVSRTVPFGKDILKYEGDYYALSNQRIPYHRDKTEDERFFHLTLFAIAREIEALRFYSDDIIRIRMPIGLPPAHFGSLHQIFENYFTGRGVIKFDYHGNPYSIYIEDAICFPQAYAAAVTMLDRLIACPKVLIVDIGGFTADYLLMRNGAADLSTCDSLENGVIVLYNNIRSKINAEYDKLLEESDIDAILSGQSTNYNETIVNAVERETQGFISDLFSTLRERMLDLSTGKIVFVGGGSILLKRFIEASDKVQDVFVVTDINANAKGYEFLYHFDTAGR